MFSEANKKSAEKVKSSCREQVPLKRMTRTGWVKIAVLAVASSTIGGAITATGFADWETPRYLWVAGGISVFYLGLFVLVMIFAQFDDSPEDESE